MCLLVLVCVAKGSLTHHMHDKIILARTRPRKSQQHKSKPAQITTTTTTNKLTSTNIHSHTHVFHVLLFADRRDFNSLQLTAAPAAIGQHRKERERERVRDTPPASRYKLLPIRALIAPPPPKACFMILLSRFFKAQFKPVSVGYIRLVWALSLSFSLS